MKLAQHKETSHNTIKLAQHDVNKLQYNKISTKQQKQSTTQWN